MRQFRVWLSVLVIGGGLILMAVRPKEAATGGGGTGAGGRGETGEG